MPLAASLGIVPRVSVNFILHPVHIIRKQWSSQAYLPGPCR